MRIDLHTHAFPEPIAARAMAALSAELPPGVQAAHDGRLSTLCGELCHHGFDHGVLCSIATKPTQFRSIFEWSRQIRDGVFGAEAARRIIPLPSVHPADPAAAQHIAAVAAAGFKGLKLHPYYQDFVLDSPEMVDFFRQVERHGLVVVCHTGFDIAFPRRRICDPLRIANLLRQVPGLKFVATHLGAWEDWQEVERHLLGRPIWIEISYAFDYLPDGEIGRLLRLHPAEFLLFGTDWPWHGHAQALPRLAALELPPPRHTALMGRNAARLLGL